MCKVCTGIVNVNYVYFKKSMITFDFFADVAKGGIHKIQCWLGDIAKTIFSYYFLW